MNRKPLLSRDLHQLGEVAHADPIEKHGPSFLVSPVEPLLEMFNNFFVLRKFKLLHHLEWVYFLAPFKIRLNH